MECPAIDNSLHLFTYFTKDIVRVQDIHETVLSTVSSRRGPELLAMWR